MTIHNSCTNSDKVSKDEYILDTTIHSRFYRSHNDNTVWNEIDLNVDNSTDSLYWFSVNKHKLIFTFGSKNKSNTDSVPLVRCKDPKTNGSFALYLDKIDNTNMSLLPTDKVGNTIYFTIDSNSVMTFTVDTDSIQKKIICNSEPEWSSISFVVTRGGCKTDVNEDNTINCYRIKNDTFYHLFRVEKAVMYDSSVNEIGLPSYSIPTMTIEPINGQSGKLRITISLDRDWLSSAVYPIVIDPTITLQYDETNSSDVRNYSAMPTSVLEDGLLSCVNLGVYAKSFLYFSGLSAVSGLNVSSAILTMYRAGVASSGIPDVAIDMLNRSFVENQLTWNKASSSVDWSTPGCDHISNDRAGTLTARVPADLSGGGMPTSFDVTSIVQTWAADISKHKGFVALEPTNVSYVHWYSATGASDPLQRPKISVIYSLGDRGNKIPFTDAVTSHRPLYPFL